MCPLEMVRDPPADPIELDAEDDLVAVRQDLAFVERQVLGREHLQLKRDGQAIPRPPRAKTEEAFARLEHGPRRNGLKAVEIR